jgi:hypothetical protein
MDHLQTTHIYDLTLSYKSCVTFPTMSSITVCFFYAAEEHARKKRNSNPRNIHITSTSPARISYLQAEEYHRQLTPGLYPLCAQQSIYNGTISGYGPDSCIPMGFHLASNVPHGAPDIYEEIPGSKTRYQRQNHYGVHDLLVG